MGTEQVNARLIFLGRRRETDLGDLYCKVNGAGMTNLNLIVKVKDATEGEVRKALKSAGIEIRSIAVVHKETDKQPETEKKET